MLTRRHLIALSAAQTFALNLFIREGRAQTLKADFPNKPVSNFSSSSGEEPQLHSQFEPASL